MSFSGLIGSGHCTLSDVYDVPVPVETKTYTPVSNRDLLEMTQTTMQRVYDVPAEEIDISVSLGAKGQEMFGALTVASDATTDEKFNSSLMVVLRNSYGKSLSVAFAQGGNCWTCSNKMISGDIVMLRKHTRNVHEDLRGIIEGIVRGALGEFRRSMGILEGLQGIPVSLDDCYRMVGLALGYGILRSQQASVVYDELRNPSHEEFSEMNAYSLYNHFTEALKRSPAGDAMQRHRRATKFFGRQFGPQSLPAPQLN